MISAVLALALTTAQDYDGFVKSWTRDGQFQGAVLVAKDGKPVFRQAFGLANSEWNIPNAPDTRFRLGSITKQFTAAAILKLAEEGKLKLDDPVSKYYDGAPAAWEKITVHRLLNHTSGIPSYTNLPGFMGKKDRNPLSPLEIVKLSHDLPLEFAPGEKFAYNNTGYVFLGHIIEKVTGGTYESHLKKTIFDPLGMSDSGYDWPKTVLPRRASGYSRDGSNAPYLDMSLPHAAGSLYSTVDDLLKWDTALHGGKVVSKESLIKMTTPGHGNYGYGLMIGPTPSGKTVIAHGGGIYGFSTNMLRFSSDGVVAIALANRETQAVGPIAQGLAGLAMGEDVKPRPVRVEVTVAPDKFDRLVGEYPLRPNFVLKVFREGAKFMTQATGQPAVEIFAESETKFFLKVVEATLDFKLGEDGKASELTLRQGGGVMTAPRK
jgi:CubicO group peptidase (beta-lactamase class C family)